MNSSYPGDWDRWKRLQASDQQSLYENFFVRLLFDHGHRWLAAKVRDVQGTILDIGCGTGYQLRFLSDSQRRTYVCTDADVSMLHRIRQDVAGRVAGKAESIPLATACVGAIVASHVLEHVRDLRGCLAECRRVLRDDGLLLVVLPCDPGLTWQALTRLSPSRRRLKALGVQYEAVMKHEHVNSFIECRRLLCETFRLREEVFYPLRVPNYHANVVCGLALTK